MAKNFSFSANFCWKETPNKKKSPCCERFLLETSIIPPQKNHSVSTKFGDETFHPMVCYRTKKHHSDILPTNLSSLLAASNNLYNHCYLETDTYNYTWQFGINRSFNWMMIPKPLHRKSTWWFQPI